jgi:hypothetical protein
VVSSDPSGLPRQSVRPTALRLRIITAVALFVAAAGSFAPVAIQAAPPRLDSTLLAQSPARPLARRKLDGRTRARAMAALGGLVILGLGLIAFTWLGARMTRRYMKSGEKKPKPRIDPVFTDDWAAKPLSPEERERLAGDKW